RGRADCNLSRAAARLGRCSRRHRRSTERRAGEGGYRSNRRRAQARVAVHCASGPYTERNPIMKYRELDDAKISQTLDRLQRRIGERFPESGLSKVCEELIAVSRETKECVEYLRSPILPVRAGVVAAIIVMWMVVKTMQLPTHLGGQADVVQFIDATASSAVFMGLAILYLLKI